MAYFNMTEYKLMKNTHSMSVPKAALFALALLLLATHPVSAAFNQYILTNSIFLTAEEGFYNESIQVVLQEMNSPLVSHTEIIGGRSTKAAEMIWLGSQHMDYGINPKVILVNLEVLGWLDRTPSERLMPFIQSMTASLWEHYSAYINGERTITLQGGSVFQADSSVNAATYALAAYFAANLSSETALTERLQDWKATYQKIFSIDPSIDNQIAQAHSVPIVTPFLNLPFAQSTTGIIGVTSFFDHAVPGVFDDSILRFDGKTISSAGFSECALGVSCYGGHNALDYRTGAGMPILAAADGVVVYKYFNTDSSAGTVDSGLYIDHNNGYRTAYWHMDPILVEYGQTVKAGDVIGLSGNIGKSSGPHLHFGLRLVEQNKAVDPYGWWSTSVSDYWGDSYWMWKGDMIADSDEAQAQLFYLFYWWRESTGYGGDTLWTYEVSSASSSTNWGIWGTYIQSPGQYNVYAYWPRFDDNTKNARYQVFHSGGSTTVSVDQSANGNQFVYLGTFNFERGNAAVILSDYTGSSGKKVQFDAIKWESTSGTPTPEPFGAGTYDDNDSRIRYSSGWVLDTTSGPYQGTRHFSSTAGSTASLDFNGQQIGLLYTADSDRGNLEVYIDGVLTDTINQRTSSINWQKSWLSLPVSSGWHTVTLKHSGGGIVDLDAVMVYSSVQTGTPPVGPTQTSTPTSTPTATSTTAATSTIAANRVNVALGKSATQSSNFGSDLRFSRASNAVDGNTNGNHADGSVTHTQNNAQAWWQVDLGSVQPISQIAIWNRTDCCSERLTNFYILVSDTPFNSTSLDAARSQSGVSSYLVSGQAGRPTTLDINRSGRYVRAQLVGTNYLSISEVQVWNTGGQALPTTTPTRTPTPTSTSVTSSAPYQVQPDTPVYLPNFGHPAAGNNWLGVAGQVFSKSGLPVNNIVVVVEGTLNGQAIDELSLTGISSIYGAGGYEIVLGSQPIASSGTLSITLYNLAGQALTDPLYFNTYADPLKNLVLINFQEK